MLVSIREAATIQLLSLPTAVCWRNYLARSCLSTFLPLRGLIEELQSFFYRAFLLIEIIFPRGNHADRFPSRDPLQLVSRPDSVLVGDGFGHRQLQLACNLRHILTIARILSLLKILQSCDLQSGDPRAKGVVAAAGDDRKVRLDPKLYEQFRNRVLRQDGWKCQSCGTMSNPEVHSNEFRSPSGHDSEET